jgi:hypothetical protein
MALYQTCYAKFGLKSLLGKFYAKKAKLSNLFRLNYFAAKIP